MIRCDAMSSLTRPTPRIPTNPAIANGSDAARIVMNTTGMPTEAASRRPPTRPRSQIAAAKVSAARTIAAVVAWPGSRIAIPPASRRIARP
jgi:hypothetical protein